MKPPTVQREIVCDLLEKYPNTSTRALARIAARDNPKVFKDADAARLVLRYWRGSLGDSNRACATDKSHFRAPKPANEPAFARIPEGLVHFADWAPLNVGGPARALVIADTHIPYHDRAAIESALRYGRDRKANIVLLNGDIADFFSVSFWEKDPRKRQFQPELDTLKQFFTALRQLFPRARIILKEGNHEERWERYMRVKAPECYGVEMFKPDNILGLKQFGIEYVNEKRPIRLGELNVLHGHEYNFAISNPVNPARGFFLRAKTHCLGAHFHQTSQHSEKNLEEKVISTWSMGCLSDLHPDYRPLNPWCLGFAFVEIGANGAFEVSNLRIINGKVF